MKNIIMIIYKLLIAKLVIRVEFKLICDLKHDEKPHSDDAFLLVKNHHHSLKKKIIVAPK